MTEQEQDLIILAVFAMRGSHRDDEMTVAKIREGSIRLMTPLSVPQIARRLPHLRMKGYVMENLRKTGRWSVTPAGLEWESKNRRKR